MPRLRAPRPDEAERLGDITRRATRASLLTAYIPAIARRATFPEGFEADLDAPGWRWIVLPDPHDIPVAFAAIAPRRAALTALYVDPDHQGQGHGHRLLRWAERSLRAHGLTRLKTDAELPALSFYLRHGWRATAATTLDIACRGRLPVVRLVKVFP